MNKLFYTKLLNYYQCFIKLDLKIVFMNSLGEETIAYHILTIDFNLRLIYFAQEEWLMFIQLT